MGCIAPLGIPALVLGIVGLRHAQRNPQARGVVHAWIGIVLGACSVLATVALLVLVVLANL